MRNLQPRDCLLGRSPDENPWHNRAAQCAAPTVETVPSRRATARVAPTAYMAFCRGRSQTGPPSMGKFPGYGGRSNSLSPLSRCARHLPLIRGVVPSPTVLKKISLVWVGEPLGAPAVNGPGTVGSANPGAVVKPHRPQFSAKPGPQWGQDEFRHPLRFCAPEMNRLLKGVTPVMGARG